MPGAPRSANAPIIGWTTGEPVSRTLAAATVDVPNPDEREPSVSTVNDTAVEVERPATLKFAVAMMLVGAGVRLIDIIVTTANQELLADLTRQQLEQQNLEATPDVINSAVNSAITLSVFGGIVAIILWLWMARMNHDGRKWARTVSTVFFVIAIASFLFTLTTPAPGISRLIAIASLLAGLGAIIGLWREDTSEYYRELDYRG